MKRPAYTISTLIVCAVLAVAMWRVHAQTTKTTSPPPHQYVVECAPGDCAAEIRKANEAGVIVTVASDCIAVDVKLVCIVNGADESEGEGR